MWFIKSDSIVFYTGQVFTEFDRFWFAEKPKSVMEFGSVRDKFEKKVVGLLMKNDNAILHNNYTGMS